VLSWQAVKGPTPWAPHPFVFEAQSGDYVYWGLVLCHDRLSPCAWPTDGGALWGLPYIPYFLPSFTSSLPLRPPHSHSSWPPFSFPPFFPLPPRVPRTDDEMCTTDTKHRLHVSTMATIAVHCGWNKSHVFLYGVHCQLGDTPTSISVVVSSVRIFWLSPRRPGFKSRQTELLLCTFHAPGPPPLCEEQSFLLSTLQRCSSNSGCRFLRRQTSCASG